MNLPLSQSAEHAYINELKSEISELRDELKNVNMVLKYLATSNVELAKDMQLIYDSLKQISSSVDDPFDPYGFPLVDPDDDDMLN